MNPLRITHEGGDYTVVVRTGALADLPALLEQRHPGARVALIGDDTVLTAIATPWDGKSRFTFPAGEASKSRATWADLTDRLLAARYDRHSVIVALGGGVTTDLAGFVAATYLRGIPWVAVPTTTLAMLDAAIGGKTGVDTPAGKNLVGAFHPPSAVFCDPALLATLPERHFREGLAEAVKHGAILDAPYGEWLKVSAPAILRRDPAALEYLIERSVALKAAIVMADEREGDCRAVLNAGHTIAHGLERVTGYRLPHGEAVAIGLVLETRVAERTGHASPGTADQIVALCLALDLPTAMPGGIGAESLIDAMQNDKKNRSGVVHAALVASFGTAVRDGSCWTVPLDLAVLRTLI